MEISATISNEAMFFLASFVCGMGIAFVYDIFRILRRLIPHDVFWVGMEDVCYWTFCTIAVFLLFYYKNDGRIRGFSFVGILIGFIIYYVVMGRFVVKSSVAVLRWLISVLGHFFRVIFGPLIKILRKIFLFLAKMLKKIYKVIKMGVSKR